MFKLHDLIGEITQWIDQNIQHSLDVNAVAARSGYSKWYLQRIFHQIKGKTLSTYIRDEKLRLVARDLVESLDTLYDIRCRYGFDSSQSFTRSFTNKYHIPPQRYRRKFSKIN